MYTHSLTHLHALSPHFVPPFLAHSHHSLDSPHRILEFHIVSDHIFLAATMLICLHTEVVCLMSDMLRQERRLTQPPGRVQQESSLPLSEVALTLLLVLALFLYLFTAADMYFTAKYFHFPLVSALFVFGLGISLRCEWVCLRHAMVLETVCANSLHVSHPCAHAGYGNCLRTACRLCCC